MYITNKLYLSDIKKIISKKFAIFKNKTFFITGASGLVGSFVVDTLMYLNKNFNYNIKIIATFTSKDSYKTRFKDYENEPLFMPFVQNIIHTISCDSNIDYIIHAASNTHPKLYATKPVETIDLNINGTLNILNFAKSQINCRTIFLSTLEVYGEDNSVLSFSEADVGKLDFNAPRSCYPESKRLCETLCQSFIAEYNLDIVIARLGYIYGPTVKLNSTKADVQFLNNALNGKDIVLKSSGTQKRSYCYVADVASAIFTILLSGICGDAYNIATEDGNILLRDYASILAKLADVKIIFSQESEVETKGGSKVQNSTLNSTKLKELGWKPKFKFTEGLNHTYQIKKENCVV